MIGLHPLKHTVVFDTSYLNYSLNNNHISNEFSTSKYLRFIPDTVIDEILSDRELSPSKRLKVIQNLEEKEINFLEDYRKALLKEFFGPYSVEKNEDLQRRMMEIIKGTHPNQKEKDAEYKKLRDERKLAKKNYNSIACTKGEDILVKVEDIQGEINKIDNGERPYDFYLDDDGTTFLRIKDNEISLHTPNGVHKTPRRMSNLKGKLPSFYNLILYDLFIESLKKPQSKSNSPKYSVIIQKNNLTIPLTIDNNLLPDFRIALQTLH